MMSIKPIETIYNGYRFRSRIEARWAVFFDAAGIVYEYEKEGFDLGGLYYLPDFWLPKFGMWFEVKGAKSKPDEIDKAIRLSEGSDKHVLLCEGPPEKHEIFCFPDLYPDEISDVVEGPFQFLNGQLISSGPYQFCEDLDYPGDFWLSTNGHNSSIGGSRSQSSKGWPALGPCERGINAAKSARFEFNETPKT